MAQILKAYDALSSPRSSNEVSSVLNSIINGTPLCRQLYYQEVISSTLASPLAFDPSSRVQLISNIITDLEACGGEARFGSKGTSISFLTSLVIVYFFCRYCIGAVGRQESWKRSGRFSLSGVSVKSVLTSQIRIYFRGRPPGIE